VLDYRRNGANDMNRNVEKEMDGNRFDDTLKVLTERMGTRRTLLAGVLLLGGAAGGLRPTPTEARRRQLRRAFQCPGPTEDTFSIGSGSGDGARQAQVFRASRTGSLRQIKIALTKERNTAGDYVVQLVKVTGSPNGTPSNSAADVLAKVTIPDAKVPVGTSTLTGTFTGPKLVQGNEYAAVVKRLGNTTLTTRTREGSNNADDCPNSQLFSSSGEQAFEKVFSQDMIVTVLTA
jgi:hypothetical protein